MKRFPTPLTAAAMAGVLAILALLAYGVASSEPDVQIDEGLARGERPLAPALALPLLDGGRASIADYRGRVVVLNYWASWCEPCRTESPLLQRWHERIQPRGGTALGVDVQDVASDAQDFMREYRLRYPSMRDGSGETRERFEVIGLPETIVVDRGRIAATRRGPVDEAFMRTVPPLLEEGA